ncbi:MAG: PH domain-containing protein [Candidatus Berkelbacteria bacterium]|nr:PH domain-containing protein [Candidatus Berkelbacteria bacterium]
MRFEGQHPGEKVIFILKKHPAVLFRPALVFILITLVPIFAFIYFKFSWIFSYGFFFWLIFGGVWAFRTWYNFQKSNYILTNMRLINIDQNGVFYKSVSETPLEKIQDIGFEIKGFWPSMWDYGTISVQTAGATERFALKFVEEPRKIKDQLIATIQKVVPKEQFQESVREVEPQVQLDIKPKQKNRHENDNSDFWS